MKGHLSYELLDRAEDSPSPRAIRLYARYAWVAGQSLRYTVQVIAENPRRLTWFSCTCEAHCDRRGNIPLAFATYSVHASIPATHPQLSTITRITFGHKGSLPIYPTNWQGLRNCPSKPSPQKETSPHKPVQRSHLSPTNPSTSL